MDTVLVKKIVALWRLYDDIQKVRIGMGHRASRRLGALQKNPLFNGDIDLLFVAGETAGLEKALKKMEERVRRRIYKRMDELDWYHEVAAPCMMEGSSPIIAAGLLAVLCDFENDRDIDRFPRVSSLWKFCGMAVGEDGRAPRKQRGKKIDWNPEARVLLQKLADLWNYHPDGYYRLKVDAWQVREQEKHGPERCKSCPGPVLHPRMRAFRRAKKEFLKTLWVRWREWEALEVNDESKAIESMQSKQSTEVLS